MALSDSIPELSFREKLIRILLYLAATAIIVYFLPREGKFRYHFQEGRPWKYGLLTASFDFPVYKTDAQIEFERDSIMQRYHPYYKMDKTIGENQIDKLEKTTGSRFSRIYRPKTTVICSTPCDCFITRESCRPPNRTTCNAIRPIRYACLIRISRN